jgi:DNA-binding transcriptional LysR family regulator
MELRQLRYFLTVVEERSISRAAERLSMTQPPLSAAISGLEKELGVPLLRRHPRGVEVTDAGAFLAQQSERILFAVEQATTTTRAIGAGRLGKITIAGTAMTSWQLLPRALATFTQRSAGADIDVVEASPEDAIDQVRNRRAAAALIYCTDTRLVETSLAEGLQVAVIRREPLVVVVPRDHPAGDATMVDLAELADSPWVVPVGRSPVPAVSELIAQAWANAAINPSTQRRAGANTVLAMVQAGLGVTILPSSVTAVAGPDVRVRPPRQTLTPVKAVLVWRMEEPEPLLSTFISAVLATPEPDRLASGHERLPVSVTDPDHLAPWAPGSLRDE